MPEPKITPAKAAETAPESLPIGNDLTNSNPTETAPTEAEPAKAETPRPKAKKAPKKAPPDFVVVHAGFGVWVKGDLIRAADLPEGCNVDDHLESGAIAPYEAPAETPAE